jgi:hypothetical protein
MGRDFSYRILFKGVRPPADAEDLMDCECGFWGGSICDKCCKKISLYKEYATDWVVCDNIINRYNKILGDQWEWRVASRQDIMNQIEKWRLEVGTTEYLDDILEALGVFRKIEDMPWEHPMAVEIKYA